MISYSIQGAGQPIVLIHGFPNDSSAWDNIAPTLAHNFKILLPDLPGAGDSPLLSEPLTMELMATAIKQMMDKENIEQAIIVGHSMGGYTAMQFAQMFPERVKGISLVHSLASSDNEDKKENRRKAIALMRKGEAEKEMFLKGMAQNLFAESFAKENPNALQKVISNGMKLSVEALTGFYTAIMNRTDKKDELVKATYPMQWIIGNEDSATPMKEALEQCHLANTNKISIYKPCGHMSFIEMPQRLIDDLNFFSNFCHQ